MDLSKLNKINNPNDTSISFSGHRTVKDDMGNNVLRVYPPQSIQIDPETQELGIEFVTMSNAYDKNKTRKNRDWYITSPKPGRFKTDDEFKKGAKTYFDIDLKKYRLQNAGEFGIRYAVYTKDNEGNIKETSYYTDSTGSVISDGDNNFTVVSTRMGTPKIQGNMNHSFTDAVGSVRRLRNADGTKLKPEDYDKMAANNRKNHVNRLGGNISDLKDNLDGIYKPYKLIMTTPLIGGGMASSHEYHPANQFKVSGGMGTTKDFLDFQIACFEKGKGYVSDGAFTSQGLEGLQLNEALMFKDSKFKYWFKNPSEDGFKLGVLPDIDTDHTGIRIVNPKNVEGYKYNPNQPSYLQFYDTRLTSKEQLGDYSKLIDGYDIKSSDDPYEITNHNDAVLPNKFEIDPSSKAYKGETYGTLKEWNKKGKLEAVLSPSNRAYSLVKKGEVGGFTGWDGNADLVKMNLSNHINDINYKEGCNQARNHLINIARYWTEETRNALIMNIANNVHNKGKGKSEETDKYLKEINERYELEEGRLSEIYKRILKEKDAEKYEGQNVPKSYNYKIADDNRPARELLQEEILNFPLESLNYSPELLGILSTPYITPRPSANGNPGASKKEIYKDAVNNGNTKLSPAMQEVYTKVLPSLINQLMFDIQQEQTDNKNKTGPNRKNLLILNGDSVDEYTPMGKYFLSMAIDDIMEFFITEALFEDDTFPSANKEHKNYDFYDKENQTEGSFKNLTLRKLGIPVTSEEDTANAVAKKLLKGLKNFQDNKAEEYGKFKEYLTKKYYKLDLEDYKIAEAAVEQTGAGLNWRFDAAKDVTDWDGVKERTITSEQAWDDVIDIWKPFMKEVRKYNPSSYVVAEVTSLHDFDNYNWGNFENADKAESIFYEETGATTGSNYSTFFGLYPKLFGQNVEEGNYDTNTYRSIGNFLTSVENFIHPESKKGRMASEFIEGSHVFLDNHDKPRAAHLMAVDAKLFWSDFDKGENKEYIKRAEKVLQRKYNDNMSSKAVAVAEKYYEYFDKQMRKTGFDEDDIKIMKGAISHLANGYKYKSETDAHPNYKKADAFGAAPYEYSIADVIEQAEVMGLEINDRDKRLLYDGVRHEMVAPYMSKMIPLYEIMTGAVGIPTIYSGDEFAQTGCETKSKNWFLANRNFIRHDWLEENRKEDVYSFNTRMNQIASLNEKPGMSPLSGGTTVVIVPTDSDIVNSLTRDELLSVLEKVGNNNFEDIRSSCAFLNCMKKDGVNIDDVMGELKTMQEDDIKSKLLEQFPKIHPGTKEWIKTNINNVHPIETNTETGAVAKYNEKGEMVLTVITNAYMPKDGNRPVSLLSENEVEAPKLSSVTFKDKDGNLIAKPNSRFIRKVYDEKLKEYVDSGVFILTKEGKLVSEKGEEVSLDSTATYFYKQKPVYNSQSKPIG